MIEVPWAFSLWDYVSLAPAVSPLTSYPLIPLLPLCISSNILNTFPKLQAPEPAVEYH